jgi:hypothetical protein
MFLATEMGKALLDFIMRADSEVTFKRRWRLSASTR